MPLARYKDTVIDATDADRSARFWASALDLRPQLRPDGVAVLRDRAGTPVVWINTVPEAKTVKNRVHIDVNTNDLDALVGAGAIVEDADTFRWIRMLDPDRQEFCAFVRDAPVTNRLYELGWDCGGSAAAAHAGAAWWAALLGADLVDDAHGYSYIEAIPDCPWESFDFAPVPEAKTVKNRVHVDLWAEDLDALIRHGATLLRPEDDEIGWTVLADPDGNEFCAFAPRS